MYCHHTGYVGHDRFGRYAGGYDTFNRVFGRDYQPGCGPCDPYSRRGLNRGYDRSGHNDTHFTYGHGYGHGAGFATSSSVQSGHSRLEGSVIHEEPTPVQHGERTVKKLVQVPVTREVKVPAVIEKVVEDVEVKEFPVTKVRQEQAVKTVQEEFVDFEEREATRMKEVWVKQQVPEKFVERVPVKKVRTVEVPYTTTKEYTEIQRVEVPVSRVVEEPGFRVDEIVEYETREVEGKQKVEWIPRVIDEIVEERDLGVRDRQVVERKVGHVVYPEHGTGHHIQVHQRPHSPIHERPHSPLVDIYSHSPIPDAGRRSPIRDGIISGPSASYIRDHYMPHTPVTAAAARPYDYSTPAGSIYGGSVIGGADSHFGIYVKESVIGLVVKSVVPGSSAAAAGLAPGDVLTTVDGLEVYSVEDWRRAIGRKSAATVAFRSKRLGRVHKVLLRH